MTKRKAVLKTILFVVAVSVVAIMVGTSLCIDKENEAEKFTNIDLSETIGFCVDGFPKSSASGLRNYYDEEGICYYEAYLPWNKETELKLICDEDVIVTIDEVVYRNGDTLLPQASDYMDVNISAPGVEDQNGKIRFISTYGLPSIHMVTENESKDFLVDVKGNTAEGYCTVLKKDGDTDYFGHCDIRVHGNTSWFNDKKSYQFNLDYSDNILGMSAQRKWILVSEFGDLSFLSDAIMYQLAKNTGDPYAPQASFVNAYLNGQYEGLYLLLQKISIEGGTISDLNDLETFNNKSQGRETEYNISGGYLVELLGELGMLEVDESLRLESLHRWMRIRSPNNITKVQHDYLSELVDEAEEALYLPDGETTESGLIWSDYFDKETWIRQFLLQEVSANKDIDLCSQYFYIKEDERLLYGGPGWDFDRSLQHFLDNERLNYVTRALYNYSVYDTAKNENGFLWLRQLDTHEDFHREMKKYYLDVVEPEMKHILDQTVPDWQTQIDESVSSDCIRWGRSYEVYKESQEKIITGFYERLDNLHDYFVNEDEYAIVTFNLPDMRLSLAIPVKKGSTIGEDNLPIFKDSADWYFGEQPFTLNTVINEDMKLTLHLENEEDTN